MWSYPPLPHVYPDILNCSYPFTVKPVVAIVISEAIAFPCNINPVTLRKYICGIGVINVLLRIVEIVCGIVPPDVYVA